MNGTHENGWRRVYLYTRYERFWHWFQAAMILALLATGLEIHGSVRLLGFARAVAVRSQQLIDNSQEFVGQGLSNILGSFFSAYATSGSFTRTGLNFESGAKTPLAAVFSAVILTGIVLLVAPPGEGVTVMSAEDLDAKLRKALATLSVKDAASVVAAETGQPRRQVYARAVEIMALDRDA